jgi:hypothetical protein
METERLEFNKIEEPEDFSDLKEINGEQALEVGFLCVTGSTPLEVTFEASNAANKRPIKFAGIISEGVS